MGGHGGLNILPQKKWNVYNFDNREKVRLDEEAAAKEEQLKREQSRKRDSELRLEKLRQARGLAAVSSDVDPNKPSPSTSSPPIQTLAPPEQKSSVATEKSEADSRHINLFEGIRIFDPIKVGEEGRREEKKGKFWRESKKVKKEEVRAVGPEDEKYRVGYGIAGKGVKLPWYLEKRAGGAKSDDDDDDSGDSDDCCDYDDVKSSKKRKAGGKKSLEELREERLKRESAEKQRERALIIGRSRRDVSAARDLGFSGRRR